MADEIEYSKFEHRSFFEQNEDSVYSVMATKTKREKIITESLDQLDIPYYLPIYTKIKRYKKGTQIHELPLFEGYVFYKNTPSKYTELLQLSNKYITTFEVGQSDTELFLNQLNIIKKMLTSKTTVKPYEHFKKGDKVRIKTGPMKDMEGYIVTEKKRYLFVVKIDILGQSVCCEIDPVNFA